MVGFDRSSAGVHRSTRRAGADDRGIVLVLVTLSMVAILGVAAIAIDLGNGYSTSRRTQNASDDAALAATRALACYEFQNPSSPNYSAQNGDPYPSCPANVGVNPSTIDTIAQTVATSDNGSQQYTCDVITSYDPATYTTAPYYKVIAPCSSTGSWDTDPTAAGVFVSAKSTQTTSFGRAAGTPNLAETRQAAATIQELINPASNGIILVCGGFSGTPQQVDPITGDTVPPLVEYDSTAKEFYLNTTKATSPVAGGTYNGPVYNPTWGDGTTNPYTGQQYGQPILKLHDSSAGGGVDSCNLSSSAFHGIDENGITVPGWNTITPGDRAGPVNVSIAGEPGCSASDLKNDPAGCFLVLPICTASNNAVGSSGAMYCVAWGAFELLNPSVNGTSGNEQYFGFTGVATVSSGGTATGGPNGKVVNVIQLVQ